MPIKDALDKYLPGGLIHWGSFDCEGSEYRLLPELVKLPSHLNRFCQITVEFHGPISKYGMTDEKVRQTLAEFFDLTMFAPLSSWVGWEHRYVNLLNFGNVERLKLFAIDANPQPTLGRPLRKL